MHTFIELWNTTDRWLELSTEQRKDFMEQVGTGVQQLTEAGVETLGWGLARPDVDAPAPYRFFAIWQAPDAGALDVLQRAVADSGWYEYFEQINTAGQLQTPDDVVGMLIHEG